MRPEAAVEEGGDGDDPNLQPVHSRRPLPAGSTREEYGEREEEQQGAEQHQVVTERGEPARESGGLKRLFGAFWIFHWALGLVSGTGGA